MFAVFTVAFSFLLVSCAGTGPSRFRSASTDYRTIPPIWVVRNAPVPVPHPVRRPAPPTEVWERAARQASPSQPKAPPPPKAASTPSPASRSAGESRVDVKRGDTVYAISRRTGVHVRTIIARNNLSPPYLLRPGDSLVVPTSPVHEVKRGETSYSISRAYDIDLAELMQLNRIDPPYTLYPGQKLKLPPSVGAGSASVRNTALPSPPPRAGNGFDWPVRGRIVSTFGPKSGGLHNDGINIAADRGTPVMAAEAGVVAYASDGLRGYGNLVLLQHDGGWVTAYAHNDRLMVSRGDRVRRGQKIAVVGSTGGVNTAQLHFEIRKGRRALNPMDHLPR